MKDRMFFQLQEFFNEIAQVETDPAASNALQ